MPCPALKNLLKLRRENKLDLTPVEKEVYFDSFFDYAYNVFKVPNAKTWESINSYLSYLEDTVVLEGFKGVKTHYFEDRQALFLRDLNFDQRISKNEKLSKVLSKRCQIINYTEFLEDDLDYYFKRFSCFIKTVKNQKNNNQEEDKDYDEDLGMCTKIIEHFYIKSSTWGGQPFLDKKTGQAYMGVDHSCLII